MSLIENIASPGTAYTAIYNGWIETSVFKKYYNQTIFNNCQIITTHITQMLF